MLNYPYVFHWDRQGRKGQFCRVTARGKMNSCCLEFEDGYKMITSRNALRRRQPLARLARGLTRRFEKKLPRVIEVKRQSKFFQVL